jgi:hypothetical protein
MQFTLSTPSLLFPAISLLLLAYTNRFLTLASLIRDLQSEYRRSGNRNVWEQIDNLRARVTLIKYMQAAGAASLLVCVLCMFLLFAGWRELSKYFFGGSLVLMMLSLALSLREIWISVTALNLQLSDIEEESGGVNRRG